MAELAAAEKSGDPVAHAEALSLAHNCVLGPDHEELRATLAKRLVTVALRSGRRGDLLMGLLWQTADLFLSDLHARRRLAELREMLDEQDYLAVGYVVRTLETMLALRSGALDLAEARAQAGARAGADAGRRDAAGALARLRGRGIDETRVDAQRCNDGFCELPRSSSWLATMYGVVEAAHMLGDAESAAEAGTLLRPFAHLPMMASLGVACFGSTRHALGVVALTLGDNQEAVDHLRAAVRHNLAIEHRPALALSRWRLSEALARCGEAAEAARLRTAAAEDAELIGMALPEPAPAPPRRPPGERPVCRRDGTDWLIGTVRVRHCVGLQHLAVLLANPGREVPAIDLVAGPGAPELGGAGGVTQPVLDDTARREYRRRLSELEAEIEDAERDRDIERAARLRTEREWLTAELAGAAGLHGRARVFVDGPERARVAVGKAIRRAMDRIARVDPALAEELRATVHTGVRCSYRPR